MTPGRRHALLASAALAVPLAYEAVEVRQGDEGWPYSRFIGFMPLWLFLGLLGLFNGWFCPHIVRKILRRTAAKAAAALDAFDTDRPEIEEI